MNVKLLSFTNNPEYTVYMAARTCYSKNIEYFSYDEDIIHDDEKVKALITKCIESGHHSVLEHANFTFAIINVSRALLAQITRHRIASFSVRSMRYTSMSDTSLDDFIYPRSSKNEYDANCEEFYKSSLELYDALCKTGFKKEEARMVLPNGSPTNIVITMNARELLHFFSLRCCSCTQLELRIVANKMLSLVKEVAPIIFQKAGATCVQKGYCPEKDRSCGRSPTLDTLLKTYEELNHGTENS